MNNLWTEPAFICALYLAATQPVRKRCLPGNRRSLRISLWEREKLHQPPNAGDGDPFIKHFRVACGLFEWIAAQLSRVLYKDLARGGLPVPKRLAIALYRWAHGTSEPVVSHVFQVSRTAVRVTCKDVAVAIKDVIRMPPPSDLAAWGHIASGFASRRGIYPCGGAIDGTHFRLQKPPGDEIHNAYTNRKGTQ
ncbi:uncharacterized protein EV422DRAFT_495089 [Fimicolochytrium jonesii]|uniref:uncharacterized protein n=1 Tax=Fimicolochytrium jonesii TaxID=1396493 RepID=UPI0022FE3760|nr:uncharacterized protein EV422DRAFT_495089 [Fimicolochytrium jonesii]KAI8821995.1 hypothetical protein EV422DRAFT_495089 [Fimicolochytrium jonesii]